MRRHILEAAVRCLGARGHADTRMQDIAAEAGQNEARLHDYFPSKGVLVVSLVDHCARATVRELRSAPFGVAAGSADRVRLALASLFALARRPSLETKVLTDLAALGSHDAAVRVAVGRALDDIGQEIARRLDTANSAPAVALLTSIVLGLVVLEDVFALPWRETDESRDRVLEAMTRALLVPPLSVVP